MFSFHKPKIYRSSLGCCICKAKSSSSRFTDSQKYEAEFERCFRIEEKRSGEICNACVLLVKRWKKLSPENRLSKHWHHVVDARAGPGTKLNTNRRLISNNSSTTSGNGQATGHRGSKSSHGSASDHAYGKSDVMPLSLSQSGNHQASTSTSGASSSQSSTSISSASNINNGNNSHASTSHNNNNHHLSTPSKRTSSFSKALAIDTNVSTFTFGEPRRKTYGESYNPYATQHLYPASSYASMNANNNYNNNPNVGGPNGNNGYYYSNSTFTKPQSALSSSAFESVMKRFRQRQQQQQLRAQKRQQQKLHQQASQKSSSSQQQKESHNTKPAVIINAIATGEENNALASEKGVAEPATTLAIGGQKRLHRTSESSQSVTQALDGFRVSSVLDCNVWKRERTCCGTIFRGLNMEIAIFPKLFKPCQHRMQISARKVQAATTVIDDGPNDECEIDEPRPRTVKSGSVSSCDSNTSGTGSMEQANFEPCQSLAVDQILGRNSRQAIGGRRNTSKKNQVDTSPKNPALVQTSEAIKSSSSKQRLKPNNIPTIATRSQRGRSANKNSSISNREEQQSINSSFDEIASTTSNNSHASSSISALDNSILQLNDEQNTDEDTGDDAEIVEEMEDDEEDEDVEEEDFDDDLEGSELAGPVDGNSDLGAISSSLLVDEEEDSTDASYSVESLVGSSSRKATVG